MRCDIFAKSVEKAGFIPILPEAGAFLCASWKPLELYCDLSQEEDVYLDYKFAKWYAKKWKVLGIPPSAFYSDNHKKEPEYLIRFLLLQEKRDFKRS